ncbi:MAG: hypothetical protein M1816_005120 [Peltula sp. TS41687]|nr:MAG: hypothetical protein M1816_005120 [Peltula sp. TS41687]
MAGPRKSSVWSKENDQQLVDARKRGQNWTAIQQAHFSDKTANACRKRHERLMGIRSGDEWESQKFDWVAKEYMNVRKQMWTLLADRVGEKWQQVETKCMEKGFKNIQTAARSASRKEQLNPGLDTSGMKPTYPTGLGPSGKENYTSGADAYGGYPLFDSGLGELGDESSLSVAPDFLGERPMRAGN